MQSITQKEANNMDYLVYLIYPVMVVLLLLGAKFYKRGQWNEEFLDYGQTKYFQGFLAVCIMLHHIGQEMGASWQTYTLYPGLEFFIPLGYVIVSIFMFCSGYGLFVSYEQKPNYLSKGFFRRRVLPLIIGFYASAWIFFIARLIMGQKISGMDKLFFLTGVKLSNPYGWFAFVMPLFYLIYYLAFKFSKKPILVTTLCVFAYTFLGTCIDHNDYLMTGEWWYNCVHMFWIGMLIAKYRDKLIQWAKKLYALKLIIFIVLLQGSWYLVQFLLAKYSYYGEYSGLPMKITVTYRWICLIGDMLYTALFTFTVLMIGMKVRIGNKFLGFMGTITFEFYLIHGLVIEFFAYRFCDVVNSIVRITNGALMIAVVFTGAIPLALGLKKICHVFDRKKK